MSDITDQIVFKGSPNFDSGRSGHQVVAIVDHIMEGGMVGSDMEFHNSDPRTNVAPFSVDKRVSAHFGVGKDGSLWQWVNTADTAWANGVLNQPDTRVPWIADAVSKGINPNMLTISIEHAGNPGDVFPPEQYATTLALHRFLIAKFTIPVDRQHIIGHYQIDNVNRHFCPGPSFPWDTLIADLGGKSAPAPSPPSGPLVPDGFTVVDANTWQCTATGQTLAYRARDFWVAHGGTGIFGYPLTDWMNETESDGTTKTVKYFERARFEQRPNITADTPADQCFDLGCVGAEAMAARQTSAVVSVSKTTTTVTVATPTAPITPHA